MPAYRLRSPIETERLIIRPPEPADAPHYVTFLDDPSVARWLRRTPLPYRAADAFEFIGAAEERWRSGRAFPCTIALRSTGDAIGGIGATADIEGGIEIGYWIGRPYWGSGLGGEAAGAYVAAVEEDLAPEILFGQVLPDNIASRRILTRLGFVFAGTRLVTLRDRPGTVIRYEKRYSA